LDRSCINDSGIDAICVGEGEEPIIEVVERLEAGKSVEGIDNILTSGNSPLRLRRLIEDFAAFPFMDRGLVYSYPKMAHFGIKGVWTSRGCLFPCPYCFNNRCNELFKTKGKIVRRRSVDSIIEEMKDLIRNYRVDFVRIQDDVFVYRADDWLKEFAEKWSKEVNKPFYCLLRAELVTDEMAYYLKKAGCFSICMSIEAADDDVRMRMLRRKASKQQMENAFQIFKKHKINVYANSIFAFPFTTLDYDIASVDFAIKMQPEMPNFCIFMPYPGTDLGDYCVKAGVFDPEKESIDYGMRNMSPLNCFSEKEKRAQYNLCQLAIVAAKLPALRNFIVKHLIYWKPNKVFFLVHYVFAITAYGRKIFWFKRSLKDYLELFIRTVKHYLYDYTKKKKDLPKAKIPVETGYTPLSDAQRKSQLRKCMDALASSRIYYRD